MKGGEKGANKTEMAYGKVWEGDDSVVNPDLYMPELKGNTLPIK